MLKRLAFCCGLIVATAAMAQTPIDVQPAKQLTRTNTLSTCAYVPVELEKPFLQKLPSNEQVTGSFLGPAYTIQGKRGRYISWFGVVRGISLESDSKKVRLLLEQKFFDGLTDCHIMLVAFTGAGDFRALLEVDPQLIPPLSLVRVYGNVVDESFGTPEVAVEYIRVWPWLSFTFTDLGAADHGNPRWASYCATCKRKGRIYDPFPKEDYYRGMLGDPKSFGLNLDDSK